MLTLRRTHTRSLSLSLSLSLSRTYTHTHAHTLGVPIEKLRRSLQGWLNVGVNADAVANDKLALAFAETPPSVLYHPVICPSPLGECAGTTSQKVRPLPNSLCKLTIELTIEKFLIRI